MPLREMRLIGAELSPSDVRTICRPQRQVAGKECDDLMIMKHYHYCIITITDC